MWTQYNVLSYRITLYFHGYKLAIETYENGLTKWKDKKQKNSNLVVSLLELILTKKTLITLENEILRPIKQPTKKILINKFSMRLLKM